MILLHDLDRSYNPLQDVDFLEKVYFPLLGYLNLQNNRITSVREEFFRNLSNLKLVHISNNNFSEIHRYLSILHKFEYNAITNIDGCTCIQ